MSRNDVDRYIQRVKGNILELCEGKEYAYDRIKAFMLQYGDGTGFKSNDNVSSEKINKLKKNTPEGGDYRFSLFCEQDLYTISSVHGVNILMGVEVVTHNGYNGLHFAYYSLQDLVVHDFDCSKLAKKYCQTAFRIVLFMDVSPAAVEGSIANASVDAFITPPIAGDASMGSKNTTKRKRGPRIYGVSKTKKPTNAAVPHDDMDFEIVAKDHLNNLYVSIVFFVFHLNNCFYFFHSIDKDLKHVIKQWFMKVSKAEFDSFAGSSTRFSQMRLDFDNNMNCVDFCVGDISYSVIDVWNDSFNNYLINVEPYLKHVFK
jgi:hypothetical protein